MSGNIPEREVDVAKLDNGPGGFLRSEILNLEEALENVGSSIEIGEVLGLRNSEVKLDNLGASVVTGVLNLELEDLLVLADDQIRVVESSVG